MTAGNLILNPVTLHNILGVKFTEFLEDFLLGGWGRQMSKILKGGEKNYKSGNYIEPVTLFNWEMFRCPLLKVLPEVACISDSVTDKNLEQIPGGLGN